MKLNNYTCDLCGAPVINIADLQEVTITCSAAEYTSEVVYHVCPFCAQVIDGIDSKTLDQFVNDELRSYIEGYKNV